MGRWVFWAVVFGLLALAPAAAEALDEPYLLDLARRFMIFAIAAVSLDLILGYGGLISFGHAAYLGLGAYAVAILSYHGVDDGWTQLATALCVSALVALAIGAVSLRTRGVYFIMITLAFAQMLYYLGVSLETYGGDDGLALYQRSDFGLDLHDGVTFHFVVLAALLATVALVTWLVNTRFGWALRGARENEARMLALGAPVQAIRLVAFVVAGALCGVAGVLLANHTEYVTPEIGHWTRSGELMFMVILGGMGTVRGAVIGAFAYLMLEWALSSLHRFDWLTGGLGLVLGEDQARQALETAATHWHLPMGLILLAAVLSGRAGLLRLLGGRADP